MPFPQGLPDSSAEWLEANGLGGFASGTVSGIRTRRYHALLLTATRPPDGRVVLVNGFDAWAETPAGRYALTSQAYAPGVEHPDGARRISGFRREPWPSWTFDLEDGTRIAQEILVPKGASIAAVSWRLVGAAGPLTLSIRPFLSGRDHHALHHENPAFAFEPEEAGEGAIRFRPYAGLPSIAMRFNGRYEHAPDWYRNFLYAAERARGLDFAEDLAAPGTLVWRLEAGGPPAVWLMAAEGHEPAIGGDEPASVLNMLRSRERDRRSRFSGPLERAGDAYLVRRGAGETVVAGYPWFTDWGRDTFIALRGLCLATGRLEEAGSILSEWAAAVSEGMLPNFFPEGGGEPEYNAVDASLWYLVSLHEYMAARAAAGRSVAGTERERLRSAFGAILTGYAGGTRYGIRLDGDGLLAAGTAGTSLTWMDARIGDRPVTPRAGKPVEVQALWINALRIASGFSDRFDGALAKATDSFAERFWNESGGCLHDVVDPDGRAGQVDATFRPNQIFAVGGLPFPVVEDERARRIVAAVEDRLWTPMGLRTLPPNHPDYHPRYEGGVRERDGAYHQGTAWPYLAGAFVEAWVRVRGGSAEAKSAARRRFLAPLMRHLDEAGLGHVSEIADGDAPHAPRGSPFQAWSVGELLRLDRSVLAVEAAAAEPDAAASTASR